MNKIIKFQGDSGGPVVQYFNGRAVLIGLIVANELTHPEDGQCTGNNTFYMTRVSVKIDWILETINNFENNNFY